MSPPKLPVRIARAIAHDYDQSQVIVVTYDKTRGTTHVVTYGVSVEQSAQAAAVGYLVKRALGWPESLCDAMSPRAKRSTARAVAARLVDAGDALLHSLGEYVRQTLYMNREWKDGIERMAAEILSARKTLALKIGELP